MPRHKNTGKCWCGKDHEGHSPEKKSKKESFDFESIAKGMKAQFPNIQTVWTDDELSPDLKKMKKEQATTFYGTQQNNLPVASLLRGLHMMDSLEDDMKAVVIEQLKGRGLWDSAKASLTAIKPEKPPTPPSPEPETDDEEDEDEDDEDDEEESETLKGKQSAYEESKRELEKYRASPTERRSALSKDEIEAIKKARVKEEQTKKVLARIKEVFKGTDAFKMIATNVVALENDLIYLGSGSWLEDEDEANLVHSVALCLECYLPDIAAALYWLPLINLILAHLRIIVKHWRKKKEKDEGKKPAESKPEKGKLGKQTSTMKDRLGGSKKK